MRILVRPLKPKHQFDQLLFAELLQITAIHPLIDSDIASRRKAVGNCQILYARPISTYFDLQAGVRIDANSSTTSRTWGAFGIQGLSMYFFDLEATGFVGDGGALAARLAGSYDLLITQKLILQPQIEMNLYSQATPSLMYGAGFSSIEAGVRLRYEITRKFAPYIGVHYEGKFGQTATLVKQEGERPTSVGLVFGVRSWF